MCKCPVATSACSKTLAFGPQAGSSGARPALITALYIGNRIERELIACGPFAQLRLGRLSTSSLTKAVVLCEVGGLTPAFSGLDASQTSLHAGNSFSVTCVGLKESCILDPCFFRSSSSCQVVYEAYDMSESTWECSRCAVINNGYSTSCLGCGAARTTNFRTQPGPRLFMRLINLKGNCSSLAMCLSPVRPTRL
jgi:hypothetical protein